MCQPYARYPLLRRELGYKSHIPVRLLSAFQIPPMTSDIHLVVLLCSGTIRHVSISTHMYSKFSLQISDLCIRFIWLTYILSGGLSIELRTFIAGMLEMLRRIQWNFCTLFCLYPRVRCLTVPDRVENKHLNNMEEYRITRELPLPYHFDAHPTEEETYIARLQLRKRLARLS